MGMNVFSSSWLYKSLRRIEREKHERKQMEIKYAESAEKYRLSHSIKLMEEMLHESIVENT